MDCFIPLLKPFPALGQQVIHLQCGDALQVDRDALAKIFRHRPSAEVDEIICSVLEKMAHWLDRIEQGRDTGCADQIGHAARRIVGLSAQIGLPDLALVAGHVADCAASGDPYALAATIARLERAFDTAVVAVWDFRDP